MRIRSVVAGVAIGAVLGAVGAAAAQSSEQGGDIVCVPSFVVPCGAPPTVQPYPGDVYFTNSEAFQQAVIRAVGRLLSDEKIVPNGDGTFYFVRS